MWAPGAFELPFLAERRRRDERFDAIVAWVRDSGETPHFEYVAGEVARASQRCAGHIA